MKSERRSTGVTGSQHVGVGSMKSANAMELSAKAMLENAEAMMEMAKKTSETARIKQRGCSSTAPKLSEGSYRGGEILG